MVTYFRKTAGKHFFRSLTPFFSSSVDSDGPRYQFPVVGVGAEASEPFGVGTKNEANILLIAARPPTFCGPFLRLSAPAPLLPPITGRTELSLAI